MNLRSLLYKAARVLGDAQAVAKGKILKRLERRLAGRLTGKLLGRLLK